MLERRITPDQANAVFDILVEHAGAANDEFGLDQVFFLHAVEDRSQREVRIGGALGASGRLCTAGDRGVPYVDCDTADETPARRAIIWKVNRLLAELFAEEGANG